MGDEADPVSENRGNNMEWFRAIELHREPDAIIQDGQGEPYLLRWHLTPRRRNAEGMYLHQILKPDAQKDPHCHPWDFDTWILSGGYTEVVCSLGLPRYCPQEIRRTAGDYVRRPATHCHVITRVMPDTWTLMKRTAAHREWGFYDWETGAFEGWEAYLQRNPGRAA